MRWMVSRRASAFRLLSTILSGEPERALAGSRFGTASIIAMSMEPLDMAQAAGARRAILLGYDCKLGADGSPHWHGKHPEPRTNCVSLPKWPDQFRRLAKLSKARGFRVVNATRDTALDCFARMPLEDALERATAEEVTP